MIGSGIMRPGGALRRIAVAGAVMAVLLLAPLLAVAAPFAGIVMDARTGQILWQENADTRLHPASLTKMLTLYIAFDAIRRGEIKLDDMVTVSANAAAQPPSRLGLKKGQRISMRHLIRAAAIKSANDAATAIGDHISGSEAAFAQRMNRTAKALGMTRSSFRNANGLTADGHLSTARDMTLLGRRLFYDFPEYYGLFSRITEDAGVARVANTNRRFLEGYRGADGIKTGYTNAAGFNLTASAERGNKRVIATVMGGTSTAQRNQRMAELMDIGFGNAPATARVQRPAAVALDEVAQAPAAGGAAKRIRLNTALAQSPRPPARPATIELPAAMVAEVTTGVSDVLAALAAPAAEPAAEAAPVAATDAPTQLAAGLLSAPPPARPASLAAPAPAASAAAAANAAVVEVAEAMDPAVVPPAESVVPPSRPVPPATAPDADAAPLPLQLAAEESAPVQLAAATPDPAADPVVADDPAPEQLAAAVDPAENLPIPPAEDDDALPDAAGPTGRLVVPQLADAGAAMPRPRARPGEIVMTMAAATPERIERVAAVAARPPTGEVVTRVSTSGGHHWGITLGKFPNRGAAERALLQTALAESRTLDGALRKVIQRGGAWEATFAGLPADRAELACRRLQARAINCFALGP